MWKFLKNIFYEKVFKKGNSAERTAKKNKSYDNSYTIYNN